MAETKLIAWLEARIVDLNERIVASNNTHEQAALGGNKSMASTVIDFVRTRKPISDDDILRALDETAIGAQAKCGFPSSRNLIELARAVLRLASND